MLLVPVLYVACNSPPPAVDESTPSVSGGTTVTEHPDIHGASSQEVYDATLAELQTFIDNLNRTISARNYSGWRNYLSDEYFQKISSAEFLAEASESPSLKTRKITLRSANDYFTNVVVPSRANSRVDEIDFEDDTRVKAYYIETRNVRTGNETVTETRRLRLYDLIKVDGNWKIVN